MPSNNNISEAGRSNRPAQPPDKVKVWDIGVRTFHWSLVAAYLIVWVSAEQWDTLHEKAGYVIAGLLAFRLIWGLVGGKHARFSDFVYKPSIVFASLRDILLRKPKRYIGHNPLGGAMIIALLISLLAATISGIAMISDRFWGIEWVEEIHEATASFTLVLVALHIIGVIYSSLAHRENLVRSMITGFKRRPPD